LSGGIDGEGSPSGDEHRFEFTNGKANGNEDGQERQAADGQVLGETELHASREREDRGSTNGDTDDGDDDFAQMVCIVYMSFLGG
jgi:hypothetical protein